VTGELQMMRVIECKVI